MMASLRSERDGRSASSTLSGRFAASLESMLANLYWRGTGGRGGGTGLGGRVRGVEGGMSRVADTNGDERGSERQTVASFGGWRRPLVMSRLAERPSDAGCERPQTCLQGLSMLVARCRWRSDYLCVCPCGVAVGGEQCSWGRMRSGLQQARFLWSRRRGQRGP